MESSTFDVARKQASASISLQAAMSALPADLCFDQFLSEVTAEGYPGYRYHAGSSLVDEVENFAIQNAQDLFCARFANVQPLSCSLANIATFTALARPGSAILSLGLADGGHLSHGAPPSLTAKLFDISHYGLKGDQIDFDEVLRIAKEVRPKIIVAGASSFPLQLNYAEFAAIALTVDAELVADVSHVAGLIAAGLIDSPIPHATVVTTSLYKQLFGPRGGLILSDADPSSNRSKLLDKSVFPGVQGTPDFHQIAMKGVALLKAQTPPFRLLMNRVLSLASTMADEFVDNGIRLVCGGTETHMLLLDLRSHKVSGAKIEKILEECGVLANRNLIPGDVQSPRNPSGLRIGTNSIAYRNFDSESARQLAASISSILKEPDSPDPRNRLKMLVGALTNRFPLDWSTFTQPEPESQPAPQESPAR